TSATKRSTSASPRARSVVSAHAAGAANVPMTVATTTAIAMAGAGRHGRHAAPVVLANRLSVPVSIRSIRSLPANAASVVPVLVRRRHQDLPGAVRLQRTDQSRRLHAFDHARGAVVPDLQPPLDAGDRGLARLQHDLHGLVVQGVLLRVDLLHRRGVDPRQTGGWTRR